ncbi:phosphate-starvation-inducible protein PsiE [Sulfurirhabdus autotrophica]|uniref:Protein PsiE n=1 Tax=Sulfurirhabdus autotrophica TaxID=1706046 RepID=A0A4R3XZF4_9PROT|nr:phosphate-starvation-inducible PsiE family protein [Sulfurirhabdus autotrophica]TCV84311.1 protein PsiE [Sulfurirhabdus autotrophica]
MAINNFRDFNRKSLALVEHLGLLVIVIATVIATITEIGTMFRAGEVKLVDLLMLFLFLEVLSMVGLYYRSGKLPVRFPLYIGMVALARYMVLDMKEMDEWRMLAVTGAILLLAVAVLVIRYGHTRFPYNEDEGHG